MKNVWFYIYTQVQSESEINQMNKKYRLCSLWGFSTKPGSCRYARRSAPADTWRGPPVSAPR